MDIELHIGSTPLTAIVLVVGTMLILRLALLFRK